MKTEKTKAATDQPEPRKLGRMPEQLQEKLLTALVWKKRIARDIVKQVPVSAWDEGYQNLVAACYRHIEKYREGPAHHIADLLMDDNPKGDSKIAARNERHRKIILMTAELNETLNVHFIRGWMGDFMRRQKIKSAIVEIAPLLNNRDHDLNKIMNRLRTVIEEPESGTEYRIISSVELRKQPLPPREYLLHPVLAAKSSNIIHSWRGVGKSFLAMGMSWAVATGKEFLGWKCPKRRRVLFIDGELPLEDLLERDRAFRKVFGGVNDWLTYFPYDRQDRGMPDLGTEEGVRAIEKVINDCNPMLVVVDSIDTLKRTGDPKEAMDWQVVRSFELRQRSAGRCVVFIAHHNKQDRLVGSYAVESIVEQSIGLYASKGAPTEEDLLRFEVRFEKHRRLSERETQPFIAECPLQRARRGDGTEMLKMKEWTRKSMDVSLQEQILDLQARNYTQAEIAREIGKSEAAVRYHLKQLEAEGQLEKGDRRQRGAKHRRTRDESQQS